MVPRTLAAVLTLVLGSACAGAVPEPEGTATTPLLDEARQVAAWLRSVEVRDQDGLTWAAAPAVDSTPVSNLYSGSPGVVLFFLELHHATGDAADLRTATDGADWLLARVDQVLQQLPERHRVVLMLRDGEDLSYQEIASVLDVPIGTVRSRLARARAALKRAVEI